MKSPPPESERNFVVPRSSPSGTRYEVLFERSALGRDSRTTTRSLFADLKSLHARGRAAIESAYAQVANAVLIRVEQLEDVSAKRRWHLQSLQAGTTTPSNLTSLSNKSSPSTK